MIIILIDIIPLVNIVLIPDVNGVVGVVLTFVDWGLCKIRVRQKISRQRPMTKYPVTKYLVTKNHMTK